MSKYHELERRDGRMKNGHRGLSARQSKQRGLLLYEDKFVVVNAFVCRLFGSI